MYLKEDNMGKNWEMGWLIGAIDPGDDLVINSSALYQL